MRENAENEVDHAPEAPGDYASSPSVALARALLTRTQALHVRAERSGIVQDILRGQVSRSGYALFLRNLLPIYEALETGLEAHREASSVAFFAEPRLYRAASLASDLDAIAGRAWTKELPVLAETDAYVAHLTALATGDGTRLVPHAYARYLGDMSGGQILKRLLTKSLSLTPAMLTFYDFPHIADIASFKAAFRDALDRCGAAVRDLEPLLKEGEVAFLHNIAISEAAQRALAENLPPQ